MDRFITPLERRRHLAAQSSFAVDGLPRELVSVGDTIYFARDSGRDYHLSFPELVSYNAKTGVRSNVVRVNGKPFGSLQYTLKSDGSRLLISEYDPSGKHNALWTVGEGEHEASLASDKFKLETGENSFVRIGSTTYVMALGSIYAVGSDGVLAKKLVDYSAVEKTKRGFNGLFNWNGRLLVSVQRAAGKIDRLYLVNARTGALSEVAVPIVKGTDGFRTVQIAGKNLVVETLQGGGIRSQVFYGGDVSRGLVPYPVPTGWYSVIVSGVAGDKAILTSGTPGVSSPTSLLVTDFTSRGTRTFSTTENNIGKTFFRAGNEIYVASYAASAPYDPETSGGYVAPGGSFASDWSLAQSLVGAVDPGLYHLNFASGSFDKMIGVGRVGRFIPVGNGGYFMGRQQEELASTPSSEASLYFTDGTAAGSVKLSSLFEGPVAANGAVFFNAGFADPHIVSRTFGAAVISGSLSRSDGRLMVSSTYEHDLSFSPVGRRVFLDLDADGVRDANEPTTLTDNSGDYLFSDVNTRRKRYNVVLEAFGKWTTLGGASRTVRVSDGKATRVDFQVADRRRSASITGLVVNRKGRAFVPAIGTTVLIDLNGDNQFSVNEASTTTDSKGRFTFGNLRAGTYRIRLVSGEVVRGKISLESAVTVGVGQRVDVSA